ncbi:Vegetative incompatibility protein HET-E-1, partial [Tolypocladium paradoxum]
MSSQWFSRQKSRFRRKPLKQPESATNAGTEGTSHALQELVAETPQAESSMTNGAPSGPRPPPSIWDTAYDNVRLAESKLVDAYESILSEDLGEAIEGRDAAKRWPQMERLAQAELDKAVKHDGAKHTASQVMQVVLAVNGVVREALQAVPQGALAWTGVCFSLQLLLNPLQENQKLHDGLAHVIKRMRWYCELERFFLRKNHIDPQPSEGLQVQLRDQILCLYEALLSFLMKSVCVCHKNKVVTFLRDTFKLDDWAESLKAVEKAEDMLRRDYGAYSDLQTLNGLDRLVVFSEKQETILEDVQALLHKQVAVKLDKKNNECLQSLWVTDPRHDKTRIEEGRGGLLADAYRWVLQSGEFQRWRDGQENRLLWIRGDPGKGKTMLICGIINELESSFSGNETISYFFCESANSRVNHSTAVLRGLVHMLAHQRQALIPHIRKEYDHVGKTLFTDPNAWAALSNILSNMLQDPCLNETYLIIDALDECETGREQLARLIIEQSSKPSAVKWIISSRNWQQIEEMMQSAGHSTALSLELNADAVSAAVNVYIRHKAACLAQLKGYSPKTRDAVENHLVSNAQDTFLWVALVCKSLEQIPGFMTTPAKLQAYPRGLDTLYQGMMRKMLKSPSADDCKRILACATAVFRPISLKELGACIQTPDWADPEEDLTAALDPLIKLCGSFLTANRGVVYFVHQTAKDFLLEHGASVIFASGIGEVHKTIFAQSLLAMQETLHRDIYDLCRPGYPVEKVEKPNPDPLEVIGYSCVHWVDHLEASQSNDKLPQDVLRDGSMVDMFVREQLLHWLEALSLLRSVPDAISALTKLSFLLESRTEESQLAALLRDARRFVLYNKWAIENAPLQLYASALVFSPSASLTRALFVGDEPEWIVCKPSMDDQWDVCLQTIEAYGTKSYDVVYSHNGKHIAAASSNDTIRIWEHATGKCLYILSGHQMPVTSVGFSHDDQLVVSGSRDTTVKVWDAVRGKCLRTLEGHTGRVTSVSFSHDSELIVSGSDDQAIRVWVQSSGSCRQILSGHEGGIYRVSFSHNGQRIISTSMDKTCRIWNAYTGQLVRILDYHEQVELLGPAVASPDHKLVASRSLGNVALWEQGRRRILRKLEVNGGLVLAMAFSHDSQMVAAGDSTGTIKIWRSRSGRCLCAFEALGSAVQSIAFSPDNQFVASSFEDGKIKILELASQRQRSVERHSSPVSWVSLSKGCSSAASASQENIIFWDTSDGESLGTLHMTEGLIHKTTFSQDGVYMAVPTEQNLVIVCEVAGRRRWSLEGHVDSVTTVAFSPDSSLLVSGSVDQTLRIWELAGKTCRQVLRGHQGSLNSAVFSSDCKTLASASTDATVKIWNVDTCIGECLQTLQTEHRVPFPMALSHDGEHLITGTLGRKMIVWHAATGVSVAETMVEQLPTSVVFSWDGSLVASSAAEAVTVWEARSLICLQTFHVGTALHSMSFDSANSLLFSHIGTIVVPPISSHSSTGAPARLLRRGFTLSEDKMWITRDGENLLWLPSEYRPDAYSRYAPVRMAVKGAHIVIGCESGRVLTFSFDNREEVLFRRKDDARRGSEITET